MHSDRLRSFLIILDGQDDESVLKSGIFLDPYIKLIMA